MNRMKKGLSVILSLVLVMTSVSAAFLAFAAAPEDAWVQLVDALKNETVANARFTVSANSSHGNDAVVADPDGSVLAAAEAWYAVVSGQADLSGGDNHENNSTRLLQQVNADIKTQMQERMGAADFSDYDVTRVLDGFAANASPRTDSGSAQRNYPAPAVFTLTVNMAKTLLDYATIDDLPEQLVASKTFTFTHQQGTYQQQSWLWSTTYYFYQLRSIDERDGDAIAKSVFTGWRDRLSSVDTSATLDELVALGADAINEQKETLTAISDEIVARFSDVVFRHFYPEHAAFGDTLDAAAEVLRYTPVAEEITDLCATQFDSYTVDQLAELYGQIEEKMNAYDQASRQAKDYIEAHGFDYEHASEVMNQILDTVELARLREYKLIVDAAIDLYDDYTDDMVLAGEVTDAELDVALGELTGHLNALNTYKPENVSQVCGDDYLPSLQSLVDYIKTLLAASDYNRQFAERYAYYVQTVYAATDLTADSAELLDALKQYDGWYAELRAFLDEVRAAVGDEIADKIFKTLDRAMTDHMDTEYALLYGRLSAEVYTALDLYAAIAATYGEAVSVASLESWRELERSIGLVEQPVYDFLAATENFTLSEPFVADYARLADLLADLDLFVQTRGFDRYEQSTMDDIVREVSDRDIARDQTYVVDDGRIDDAIALLDRVLNSEEFQALTGVDLKETITGLTDNLYSDSLLNTIVQYVYPIVANEFVKVWATLPNHISMDSVDAGGITVTDVEVDLFIDAIETAMGRLGLNIFPSLLGGAVEEQYPQVAEVLKRATAPATTENNPWEDPAICDEDGKLALPWGITDRDSFVSAAVAALSGLEPLLKALLANQNMELTGSVGTGHGSFRALSIVTGTLEVDAINLVLTASANAGYNNALAPILEALGLDAPDGNTFTSTEDILTKGLLDPVDALLAKLAAAPVDVVTALVPNLVYALATGMVEPLLGMLKTDINYTTNAHFTATAAFGLVNQSGDLNDVYKSDEPIRINLQDMIDLSSLGVDLSSFESVFGLLTDKLSLPLPTPDYARLATMGELVWQDTVRAEKTYEYGEPGKAAFIQANRADVLQYLLTYVLDALAADPTLIEQIAAAFGAQTPLDLPDVVDQILANVAANGGDAIAAIVELMQPIDHSAPATDIEWAPYEGSGEQTEVVYTTLWPKEKAAFVAKHLPSFINNLLLLVGVNVNGEKAATLPELIDNALNGLFTADTVNSLAGSLANVFGKLSLGGLGDILNEQLGLDFTYWDSYRADFADGDREAFAASLTELLRPLEKVLGFVLNGEDLTVTVTDEAGEASLITLRGYDGYAYGLVPILEALGAPDVMTPDAFRVDDSAIVENLVGMLLGVVDRVEADPYEAVLDLLPNVLYFLSSGGLSVAAENLLHSVNLALDTIRPIYDVNLTELVGIDLSFRDFDVVSYLLSLLNGKIAEATGAEFALDFTTESLLSELSFGELESFTSANGKTAYRVANTSDSLADVLTVVLRYAVDQLVFAENGATLAGLLQSALNMSDESYAFLYALLAAFKTVNTLMPDAVLSLLFWLFYNADNAVDAAVDYYEYMYADWATVIDRMNDSELSYVQKAGMVMRNVYANSFMPFFDRLADATDIPIRSKDILGFVDLFKEFIELVRSWIATLRQLFAGVAA